MVLIIHFVHLFILSFVLFVFLYNTLMMDAEGTQNVGALKYMIKTNILY